MLFQLISGILLVFYYNNYVELSFISVDTLSCSNIVILRWLHVTGASMFFLFLYIHIFRGLALRSFKKTYVWLTGVIIFILRILAAFLGYTLPWGQISYWATIVITSFVSVVPYFGLTILKWILGSNVPAGRVLKFFFCLHFLVPIIIFVLVVIHIVLLHKFGRKNIISKPNSIRFFYYILKDVLNIIIFIIVFFIISVWAGFERLNFVTADSLVSPLHIKPEWYFLWLYAILRCIPHKFTGVILMILSLIILILISLSSKIKSVYLNYWIIFWLVSVIWILSWIGRKPVLNELNLYAIFFTALYFKILLFVFVY